MAYLLARRRQGESVGVAFAIGYLSHLLADVPWHLLSSDSHELGFLLWPLTDIPEYTLVKPIGTVGGMSVTTPWLEILILIVGVVVWVLDGAPGSRGARDIWQGFHR